MNTEHIIETIEQVLQPLHQLLANQQVKAVSKEQAQFNLTFWQQLKDKAQPLSASTTCSIKPR